MLNHVAPCPVTSEVHSCRTWIQELRNPSPRPLTWAGFAHCLRLSLVDLPCSWYLYPSWVSIAASALLSQLHASCCERLPTGSQTLFRIACPWLSFEIWVEAMTGNLLSACLWNEHHVDDTNVCHQFKQYSWADAASASECLGSLAWWN
jgi:hypothetical protein